MSVLRASSGLDEFPLFRALLSVDPHLTNFDDRIYNFHAAPNFMGRLSRRLRKGSLAKNFNEDIQRLLLLRKPDLFVFFGACNIWPQTITIAKENGARVIAIYPDLDPFIHGAEFVEAIRRADEFYFTKPNLRKAFSELIRSDCRFIYPLYSRYDVQSPSATVHSDEVIFIGHYSPGKAAQLRVFIRHYRGNIRIIGDNWHFEERFPKVTRQSATYGDAVASLSRAASCNLGLLMEGLSVGAPGDEITSRSILVPVWGGLLLHPRNPASMELFGDDAPFLFENIEMAAKLAHLIIGDPEMRLKWAISQRQSVLAKIPCAEDVVSGWIKNQ